MGDEIPKQDSGPSEMIRALDAAKIVVGALEGLPPPLQRKALQFASEVLGHNVASGPLPINVVGGGTPLSLIGHQPTAPITEPVLRYTPQKRAFETIADLFHATDPKSDADKALVAGYWLQTRGTEPDFDAQTVNQALKDFGHRVANITNAFNALIARRPQFVIQTKKSGTSRQARKRYKLTSVGLGAVDQMMGEAERETGQQT
jgi:hypothetical protein